jgi:hypothetical protein
MPEIGQVVEELNKITYILTLFVVFFWVGCCKILCEFSVNIPDPHQSIIYLLF